MSASCKIRVEQDIQKLEGVMEIDCSSTTASSQSPLQPETPGTASSQGSTSDEFVYTLPVVMSITPPTASDLHQLLARVQAL